MTFNPAHFASLGFVGFSPLTGTHPMQIPAVGGVYGVFRASDATPCFRRVSSGGFFKGKNPSSRSRR